MSGNKDRKSFIKVWPQLFLMIFSKTFEKTCRTFVGRKFFPTVLFCSPLSRELTAARFPLSGNSQLRILLLIASVKGTVSPSTDKDTSLGGIKSSPVDFR